MTKQELKAKRTAAWNAYVQSVKNDPVRQKEVEEQKMTFGEATMKYGVKVFGEPDDNGYPLYIALHGGGGGDTPDVNNQQWEHMGIYYADSVKKGIYINPRGVRDTWDCHANPESYPLYDRLIENMIAFCNADPNRVYIMGYSAGGDGVYLVGPRMADRFAAVHMSAGHHNGTSIINLRNTPIQLQVGDHDAAYGRNVVTVEYMQLLDKLGEEYGGYIHGGYVHKDKGHNFRDWAEEDQLVMANPYKWVSDNDVTDKLADTNAVHFLQQFTRNPLPEKIVWDLSNRAELREVEDFYYLRCDKDVKSGLVVVSLDKEKNMIVVEKNTENVSFKVLLNEDLLDLEKAVTVVCSDGSKAEVIPEFDAALLEDTTKKRGDLNYQFVASVEVH